MKTKFVLLLYYLRRPYTSKKHNFCDLLSTHDVHDVHMKITSYLPRPGSASTPSPAVTSAPWSPVGSSGPPTPPPPPAPTPAPTAGPGLASGCPCGPRSRRFTSTVSVWPVSAATSRRRPAWGWWRGAGGRMWCTSTPRRSRAGSWSMVRDRVVPASSGALQRFTLLHPVFGQQIKSQPRTTLTLTKKVHVIMIVVKCNINGMPSGWKLLH